MSRESLNVGLQNKKYRNSNDIYNGRGYGIKVYFSNIGTITTDQTLKKKYDALF